MSDILKIDGNFKSLELEINEAIANGITPELKSRAFKEIEVIRSRILRFNQDEKRRIGVAKFKTLSIKIEELAEAIKYGGNLSKKFKESYKAYQDL